LTVIITINCLEEVRNVAIDASAIIGLLIGFLVVGTVGIYVGEEMISAAGLTGTSTTVATPISALGAGAWTVPADVNSVDVVLVGSGGGGGSGANLTMLGGGGGAAGAVTTQTGLAVTPGTLLLYYIGPIGTGGAAGYNGLVGVNGTAGSFSSIIIGATTYNATGGTWGGNNTVPLGASATLNGAAGTNGYGLTPWAPAAGPAQNSTDPSLIVGINGTPSRGYGAGGPGGGAGDAGAGAPGMSGDGVGADGNLGAVLITYYTTNAGLNALGPTQQSIVDTFALGVNLCKIIVIVSIASIIFMLLQKTGLIPRFGQE
jgi:hypothetical protein